MVCEGADDGGADGRAADEDKHVQAHHAAAQFGVNGKLDASVRHRLEREVHEAHGGQQDEEGGHVRRDRRGRLHEPEPGRGGGD